MSARFRMRLMQADASIFAGVGVLLKTFDVKQEMEAVHKVDVGFHEVVACGGYRWKDNGGTCILVPGVPALWKDDEVIGQLETDDMLDGMKDCHDYHGAILLPRNISMFEPMLHALDPEVHLASIELVTNRNVLRKLFRLYSPPVRDFYGKHNTEVGDIRIDAELVGNVVLLHRWETLKNRTFGQSRENVSAKAYHQRATMLPSPDVEEGTGTDRLVAYTLNGIRMMIRFDVDACLELPPSTGFPTADSDHDDSDPSNASKAPDPKGIQVAHSGFEHVPQSDLLEVKVRHIKRDLDMFEFYPQILFAQVPNLYIARHDRHDYSCGPVEMYRLDGTEFDNARARAKPILQKVGLALQRMMELTRAQGDLAFIGRNGTLEAYKRNGGVPELSVEARDTLQSIGA